MAHDGRERERRRGGGGKAAQHLEGNKLTAAFRIWEQSGGLKGLRTEINNAGAAGWPPKQVGGGGQRFSVTWPCGYLGPELLHVALQLQGGVDRALRSQTLPREPPLADEAFLGLQSLRQLQSS